jgi:dTDP-4-amino-4,6-dideoxygalactose transaminase
MGAIGIEPGDEVIVCGYSMSISAVAPLLYGGIPVFADLESDCFCLSAISVAEKITPRTKAILIVDLFGQVYDVPGINAVAKKHGLKVVEDCAQAPGAKFGDKYAGSLGDIGVFSLNYHKHIHSGEGGIIVTNDDSLAEKMRMIRNHAESVVGPRDWPDLTNMLGFNFRMTEVEAAIALTQMDKLDGLLATRLDNIAYIEKELSFMTAMTPPKVRAGATHAYYQHAYLWDADVAGVERNTFMDAVKAELPVFELRENEGVKLGYGYVKPLYKLPIFASASRSSNFTQQLPDYSNVTCPVLEELHGKTLVHHEFMVPSMAYSDIDDVVAAFDKVWRRRDQLVNV